MRGISKLAKGPVFLPTICFLLVTVAATSTQIRHAKASIPPNIVLILTDDQRWGTLWAMPNVQADIVSPGTTFSNAIIDNPWCCPSRASFLTGQRSHTTGVWNNNAPYGGFSAFKDASTIATWLHGGGYRTALVGKYFNQYAKAAPYQPPGWDHWAAFKGPRYYNYNLAIDGKLVHHGDTEKDYSTDVLAGNAAGFIRSTPANQPLFLNFTPYAPHLPATPPARYSTAFTDMPRWDPPSYNEKDVSDKPQYIRQLPPLTSTSNPQVIRQRQYATLRAVDDGVGRLTEALRDTGRLSNTVIVFASDNGYAWGEHRWTPTGGKVVPYTETLRVPLVIRYGPLTSGGKDDHLISNIDVAPTFADLAGVKAPAAEGRSLVPFLSGLDQHWRNYTLIEHVRGDGGSEERTVPTYCGVRSDSLSYVVYGTGEKELYDLVTDPHEMTNVIDDPRYALTASKMDIRLRKMCDPLPPGFAFPALGG